MDQYILLTRHLFTFSWKVTSDFNVIFKTSIIERNFAMLAMISFNVALKSQTSRKSLCWFTWRHKNYSNGSGLRFWKINVSWRKFVKWFRFMYLWRRYFSINVAHILNIANRARLQETKVIRGLVLSPSSGGKGEQRSETIDDVWNTSQDCGHLTL